MTDHFAVLQVPRRPMLDTEALKEYFHRTSAICHPDVAGSGDAVRFAEVNAAFTALHDTVWRLRHLLELEAPEQLGRTQEIPPEFADLFMRVAEIRQAIQALLKKEEATASGLARALLIEERMALWHRTIALNGEIKGAQEQSNALLRALDVEWDSRPPNAGDRLAALHQRFSYLSKWRAQLHESLFQFQPNS